jgi:O-succinylbenzoate synthase
MDEPFPTPLPPAHDPLQLREATVYHLRPVLNLPFTTSFGTHRERDTVLLVLKTVDGPVGIGEAPTLPEPVFDMEYVAGVVDVLRRFLLPGLREQSGGRLESYDALWEPMQRFRGHHTAKTALEAAYWHLVSQQSGRPVAALWGGEQTRVAVGFSIGAQTPDDALVRAEAAVGQGFQRLKVKIWPELDVSGLLDALRARYPDILLQVDANCAYDPYNPEHQAALKALDRFDLLLIEQPFRGNDLFEHARFQAEYDLETPIGLDESIKQLEDVRTAADIWRMFGISERLSINIKPARVGGYWQGVLIADLAQREQLDCWVGGMLDLTPGKWMNISLAAHPACRLPGDHMQPQPYYQLDIAAPLPQIEADGMVAVPTDGIGCAIDWDAIDRLTVEKWTIPLTG